MPSCNHKTFLDHTSNGWRYPTGKLAWNCTNCGAVGPWTETWTYYGSIECLHCQTASMDWVACSEKCALDLHAKHGTKPVFMDDRVSIVGRNRETRKPRKKRMTIRDKANAYDQLVAEGKIGPAGEPK